jgi:hypothetical protein
MYRHFFIALLVGISLSREAFAQTASTTNTTTTVRWISQPQTIEQISIEAYGTPLCWTVIGNANRSLPIERPTDLVGLVSLQVPSRARCEELLEASQTQTLRLVERAPMGSFQLNMEEYNDAYRQTDPNVPLRSWTVSPSVPELQERLSPSSRQVDFPTNVMGSADRYYADTVLLERVVPDFRKARTPMSAFGLVFPNGAQSYYHPGYSDVNFKGSYWEKQAARRVDGPAIWLYPFDWTMSATGKIKALGWQRHTKNTDEREDQFFYTINGKDLPRWKYADGLFVAPNEERYAYRVRTNAEDTWYIVTNKGRFGPYRYVSQPLFSKDNVLSYVVIQQKQDRDIYTWYKEGKAQESWDYLDSIYLSNQGTQFSYRAMRRDANGVDRWYVVQNGTPLHAWEYVSHLVVDPFTSQATYQVRDQGAWFLSSNQGHWPMPTEANGIYQDRLSHKSYAAGALRGADDAIEDRSWVQTEATSWTVQNGLYTTAFSPSGQVFMARSVYPTSTEIFADGPMGIQHALDQSVLPVLGLAGMRPYSDQELARLKAEYPLFVYSFVETDRARARDLYFDPQGRLTLYQGDGRYLIKAVYEVAH